MKPDLLKLIDAVCDAYNQATPRQPWAPICADGGWYTFCNQATNFVCREMGYFGFNYPTSSRPDNIMLANQMYDVMNTPDRDWNRISASQAQDYANQGALVLAAEKNPQGHGHVCVVMPGNLQYSGSWEKEVPKVMNVGKSVFIGKRASLAFRQEPAFFVWKVHSLELSAVPE